MAIDWSAFDGFSRPSDLPSWQGVSGWTSAIEAQLGAERDVLAGQRDLSNELLSDLGGDPSRRCVDPHREQHPFLDLVVPREELGERGRTLGGAFEGHRRSLLQTPRGAPQFQKAATLPNTQKLAVAPIK